ncbi:MAG: family type secretion target [Subtercola sp.]|nr:family type secretion target [Subtercola sp.]
MSGGFYGADVASLRTLAKQFETAAAQLQSLTSTLTSTVNATAAWRGPDAAEFRSEWNGAHSAKLRAAVTALRHGSSDLVKNADEQNAASTDSGSGSGGGASTGGSSTGGSKGGSGTGSGKAPTLPGIGAGGLVPGTIAWGTKGPVTGDGSAGGGSVYIKNGASAHADTTYGPNGQVDHTGKADWGWGAGGETHGSFKNGDVSGSGSLDAFAGSKADAQAHSGIDHNGQAYANAKASGMAGEEANAKGTIKLAQGSSLSGSVHSLAGAEAAANAGGTIGPHGAGVNAGADAFAGAKIGADTTMNVAGVKEKVGYEAYAGIGAHANVDAQFTWDKVHLSWDAGVAYGVGGGFSQELSFSPKDAVTSVEKAFGF